MPHFATGLALLLLAGSPAAAAPPPAVELHLSYEAYAAGVPVADMTADLRTTAADYHLALTSRTRGIINLLFKSDSISSADGGLTATGVRPAQYRSQGVYRGTARETRIDYPAGHPVVTLRTPADEEPREPIPADLQARGIDGISAIVAILQQIAATGRCDASRTIFDGRRVLDLTAVTNGPDTLDKTDRSPFDGPALRCTLASRQVAGFLVDGDTERAHEVRHTTVWLKQVTEAGPLVPVRVEVETAWVGVVHIYLTGKSPGKSAS